MSQFDDYEAAGRRAHNAYWKTADNTRWDALNYCTRQLWVKVAMAVLG